MAYSDTFTVNVPIVGGRFAPAVKSWFAANGVPLIEEGNLIIGEGEGWDAWSISLKKDGLHPVKFRFKDKGIAMLFKLTWHDTL